MQSVSSHSRPWNRNLHLARASDDSSAGFSVRSAGVQCGGSVWPVDLRQTEVGWNSSSAT